MPTFPQYQLALLEWIPVVPAGLESEIFAHYFAGFSPELCARSLVQNYKRPGFVTMACSEGLGREYQRANELLAGGAPALPQEQL